MVVKVPTGVDCTVCSTKSACTFRGPDSAYRTYRVKREVGYSVGDRVRIDEPGGVLGVALLATVVAPVTLIVTGYVLLDCCVRFRYAIAVFWLVGLLLWTTVLFVANRWMTHAARFQPRIRPIVRGTPAETE